MPITPTRPSRSATTFTRRCLRATSCAVAENRARLESVAATSERLRPPPSSRRHTALEERSSQRRRSCSESILKSYETLQIRDDVLRDCDRLRLDFRVGGELGSSFRSAVGLSAVGLVLLLHRSAPSALAAMVRFRTVALLFRAFVLVAARGAHAAARTLATGTNRDHVHGHTCREASSRCGSMDSPRRYHAVLVGPGRAAGRRFLRDSASGIGRKRIARRRE